MQKHMKRWEACPGCGAGFPVSDGPMHAYIGASAGCWAIYGEVLAREYSDARYFRVHNMTVDAYAAQHPGDASRKAVQSAAIHLIAIYLTLERQLEPALISKARGKAVKAGGYVKLEPPSHYAVTILDVHAAGSAQTHCRLVREWVEDVWRQWKPHHATIREWAARALDS